MLGFIGCGNIAGAIIHGVIKSELVKPGEIIASAAHEKTLLDVEDKFQIFTSLDNKVVVSQSSILVLAIKPKLYRQIIDEIKDKLKPETVIISVAPNFTIAELTEMLGGHEKVVRAMPNTPALVSEGMSSLCFHKGIAESERKEVTDIFKSFGEVEIVTEELMDAAGSLAGCGPAYVYMIIESLTDAGVSLGLPRKMAQKMACQTLIGSSKMVLETGEAPAVLKGKVTTPGGTTIQGVRKLEEKGLRSALFEAVIASSKTK